MGLASIGKFDVLESAIGILHRVDVAVDGERVCSTGRRSTEHVVVVIANPNGNFCRVIAGLIHTLHQRRVGAIVFPAERAIVFCLEAINPATAIFELPSSSKKIAPRRFPRAIT